MRPVNLLPPEERRGQSAPLRTGPLAYVVLGTVVALLAGVTMLVLTSNQVSERKDQIATLKREDAAAEARAHKLAAYTQFQNLREQRVATVTSLADSRFDWERVMRELALVLPSDVWLVNLTATASPESKVSGGSGGNLRASIAGPALELEGCAKGQVAVAGFVTALKDIDGVTRVGVESSEIPKEEEKASESSSEESSPVSEGEGCPPVGYRTKFQLAAAFDAAPVPLSAAPEETLATATEDAEATSSEASEGSEGG
jgi:Tfp pilus assembly protein PilN